MQITGEERKTIERALQSGLLRALCMAGRLSEDGFIRALAAVERA